MGFFDTFKRLNWAANPNYPAGPNAWNGTPTKVSPSGAAILAGVEPRQMAAQHFNWLNNFLGNSPAEYLIHRALQEWGIRQAFSTSGANPAGLRFDLSDNPAVVDYAHSACAVYDGISSGVNPLPSIVTTSRNGGAIWAGPADRHFATARYDTPGWFSPAVGPPFETSLASIPGAPTVEGALLVGHTGSGWFHLIYQPFGLPGTSTLTSLPGISALHYQAGISRIFLGGWGASNQILFSDDAGVTFSARTVASWAAVPGSAIVNFAGNPTTVLLAAARGESQLALSTTSGNSWSLVTPGPSVLAGDTLGISWNSELSLFVCVGRNGYATSPDGSTWTTRTLLTGESWAGGWWIPTLSGRHVLSMGAVTAVLGSSRRDQGILYSFDLRTWHAAGFGFAPTSVGQRFTHLFDAGTRLGAAGNGFLAFSGVLAQPPAYSVYT